MRPTEYPSAIPAWIENHSDPGKVTLKNQITLHITEGTTASGAIESSRQSTHPNRTSFQFVIERDGKVFQCIPISDTAWHASQVNVHSIGIEHVGLTNKGAADLNKTHSTTSFKPMPCTDEQYKASAALVKWLCKKMYIPVDRKHVRTHFEASPADGHELCCTGGLDPDRVVKLAQ